MRFIVNYKYATKLLQKMQIRKQIDYFFKKDRCFKPIHFLLYEQQLIEIEKSSYMLDRYQVRLPYSNQQCLFHARQCRYRSDRG